MFVCFFFSARRSGWLGSPVRVRQRSVGAGLRIIQVNLLILLSSAASQLSVSSEAMRFFDALDQLQVTFVVAAARSVRRYATATDGARRLELVLVAATTLCIAPTLGCLTTGRQLHRPRRARLQLRVVAPKALCNSRRSSRSQHCLRARRAGRPRRARLRRKGVSSLAGELFSRRNSRHDDKSAWFHGARRS